MWLARLTRDQRQQKRPTVTLEHMRHDHLADECVCHKRVTHKHVVWHRYREALVALLLVCVERREYRGSLTLGVDRTEERVGLCEIRLLKEKYELAEVETLASTLQKRT